MTNIQIMLGALFVIANARSMFAPESLHTPALAVIGCLFIFVSILAFASNRNHEEN